MTELIDKARESLEASRQLMNGGFHAFAASRAYYTMFYLAEALLASKGFFYMSHGQVVGAIVREFVKPGIMEKEFQ